MCGQIVDWTRASNWSLIKEHILQTLRTVQGVLKEAMQSWHWWRQGAGCHQKNSSNGTCSEYSSLPWWVLHYLQFQLVSCGSEILNGTFRNNSSVRWCSAEKGYKVSHSTSSGLGFQSSVLTCCLPLSSYVLVFCTRIQMAFFLLKVSRVHQQKWASSVKKDCWLDSAGFADM